MKTAVIVTTYNRPRFLFRSLPQIAAAAARVQAPVLVVDDGSTNHETACEECGYRGTEEICDDNGATLLELPQNRGLAGALNIGLSYWLADPSIEAISYFQDDVEVDLLALEVMDELLRDFDTRYGRPQVITGHDAAEHRPKLNQSFPWKGFVPEVRESCRATHMHATRMAWSQVMPLRTKGLGFPKRLPGQTPLERGEGSGVDWWVVRDSPRALGTICVPGLVRTFAFKAEDSCWNNPQKAGEDGPLHRDAIQGWLKAKGY